MKLEILWGYFLILQSQIRVLMKINDKQDSEALIGVKFLDWNEKIQFDRKKTNVNWFMENLTVLYKSNLVFLVQI